MYICTQITTSKKIEIMKTTNYTKEMIRQIYSQKMSGIVYQMYSPVDAYQAEWAKCLKKINIVTKHTKKKNLEYTLQEMLLNYTR